MRFSLASLLLLGAGACTALAGLEDLNFAESAGGSGGVGGMGGDTQEGGGGAGRGGVGGVGGVGGAGGAGGAAACATSADLGTTGLCGADMKCTVTDEATGAVGCTTAGAQPHWEPCRDDGGCADGDFCDLRGRVCKPFCANANDCAAFDGECLPAMREPMAMPAEIPGAKTCISMCDPKVGSPCALGLGASCIWLGMSDFDCALVQGSSEGDPCSSQYDCAAGLACVGTCEEWCEPPGGFPGNCSILGCGSVNPQIFYMGVEQGVCQN